MTANGMRRLEIIIPDDHPIFARPPGSRAKIAREWLDLGARLSAIEQGLKDINKRFSGLEISNSIVQGDDLKARQAPVNSGGRKAEPDTVRVDDFI
jgi:hypothetical protein